MDQNKLKKVCDAFLEMKYKKKVMISEFRAMPRQKFDDEKNEWVPDSHTLFITIKTEPVDYDDPLYNLYENDRSYLGLENDLGHLLGLECCVNFD